MFAVLAVCLLAACGAQPAPPAAAPPTIEPTPSPAAAPIVSPTVAPANMPAAAPADAGGEVTLYSYRIVNTYPHATDAWTQGLQYGDGALYEGTGMEGQSSLRRVDLETGAVEQRADLPPEVFGEGITVLGDRIYQITWKNQVAYLWDRASFEQLDTFSYDTEGWGLTHDGERLIMSDGTSTLTFRDPDTFEETGRVEVTLYGQPVAGLNELEYVNGEVFANVWTTDYFVRVDPASGAVRGVVDLSGLLATVPVTNTVDVLNGIAYDAAGDRLFVTGKYWPALFEIDLFPTGTLAPPAATPSPPQP